MATVEKTTTEYQVIGTRPVRPDGIEKVTGQAIYGADVRLPGMVSGVVLRSPHAHALIKKLNTSKAAKLPGVLAVISASDLPDLENPNADGFMRGIIEEVGNLKYVLDKVLAKNKVTFKGQPVAAVAAVDLNTALEAIKFIEVDE